MCIKKKKSLRTDVWLFSESSYEFWNDNFDELFLLGKLLVVVLSGIK